MRDNDISAEAATSAGVRGEAVLQQLIDLLEKQIALVRQGKLNDVDLLTDRVQQLLGAACDCAASRRSAAMGKHIQSLHNELCLILEAERADQRQKLEKLKKGKKSLRGYHDALGTS